MESTHSKKISRFEIISMLGKGAQGTVYLAKDPYLERQVAIKALKVKPGKAIHENLLEEARNVSQLNHPNIIPLFEAGEKKGIPFLVFEFVSGVLLKSIIDQKTALTVSHTVSLMRQILHGVGYAHGKGIIHLDLKPENIMISKNGVPRVMDFGRSMIIGSEKGNSQNLRGTLQYMSPEHFSEKPLGPYTDVFALGLIFFKMLTGKSAFTGENHFNLIYKIIYEPTVAPSLLRPDVDRELDSIVLKAVQKDSQARFPDATSMKKALDEYADRIAHGSHAPAVSEKSHSTIEFLLRRIRYKTDFPAISKCITEINRLTSSESQASVKQLANVILTDYSLTNKLLKLVNSAFYKQSGESITSIHKAVVLLGFEQVRLAASSLMLFTHLKGDSSTKELRDGMIRSFMSGIIARDLTRKLDPRKTELAFICSLFHDLGKNLTIYYFPEEYAQIKEVMIENGNDLQSAAKSVLGISLDELAVGVARAWEFPENIIYCMRGLPSGAIEPPDSVLDTIRHFSVFANELCRLAESGLPEKREELLTGLARRFESSFRITEAEILELLHSEKNMLLKYASILDINPEQSLFIINLLKFIGITDNSIDNQILTEEQDPQTSDSKPAENLPERSGVPEVELSARKNDHAIQLKPETVSLPKRIWQGFMNLFNFQL